MAPPAAASAFVQGVWAARQLVLCAVVTIALAVALNFAQACSEAWLSEQRAHNVWLHDERVMCLTKGCTTEWLGDQKSQRCDCSVLTAAKTRGAL